ncbi:MAG: aminotransferase class I/II-fold pyridoxal phosphate-dependent enzyme [Pseudomonadales bacterium]|nr:aminotransferase class I/II-fold pyridoxal phosphate-dependent enzyme [Pseudomonadales bacterium]
MGENERHFVEEAFQSNWIAPLGPNVDAFETDLAAYVNSGYAAALSSGTAAIHLALNLLGVSYGDTVICSSFTFVASANPILYQGAVPIFIDSEPESWNMSPIALEKCLNDCQRNGIKPKAIIVVHLYGQSADMDLIVDLSKRFNVPIVEDAAESLGAKYKGRDTGTFGKFGIFSFNGNKIITTSGGGMLISHDKKMIEKARYLSTQAREPAPHYEHTEIGFNYRMSNVLAGIGRGQLEVLDDRVRAKRHLFDRYVDKLKEIECIEWMPEPEWSYSNRWLTTLCIKPHKGGITPSGLIEKLSFFNIEARHLWKPMHQQPLFSKAQYYPHSNISVSDRLFDTGLCLPSASNMTEEQQERVIFHLKKILS